MGMIVITIVIVINIITTTIKIMATAIILTKTKSIIIMIIIIIQRKSGKALYNVTESLPGDWQVCNFTNTFTFYRAISSTLTFSQPENCTIFYM